MIVIYRFKFKFNILKFMVVFFRVFRVNIQMVERTLNSLIIHSINTNLHAWLIKQLQMYLTMMNSRNLLYLISKIFMRNCKFSTYLVYVMQKNIYTYGLWIERQIRNDNLNINSNYFRQIFFIGLIRMHLFIKYIMNEWIYVILLRKRERISGETCEIYQ